MVRLEIGFSWALLLLALFTSLYKMINNLMPTSEEHMQTVGTVVQSYSRNDLEVIYYLSNELARCEKCRSLTGPVYLLSQFNKTHMLTSSDVTKYTKDTEDKSFHGS